jgi:hypothetical protein
LGIGNHWHCVRSLTRHGAHERDVIGAMPVNFVAFVGKDNQPLFTYCLEEDESEALHLEMITNSALDIMEEAMEDVEGFQSFMGRLLVVDAYHVFGLMSNTKIKTLIVCSGMGDYAPESPRSTGNGQSLKDLVLGLYSLYVKDLQNPLQNIDNVCTSSAFKGSIHSVVQAFSSGN